MKTCQPWEYDTNTDINIYTNTGIKTGTNIDTNTDTNTHSNANTNTDKVEIQIQPCGSDWETRQPWEDDPQRPPSPRTGLTPDFPGNSLEKYKKKIILLSQIWG